MWTKLEHPPLTQLQSGDVQVGMRHRDGLDNGNQDRPVPTWACLDLWRDHAVAARSTVIVVIIAGEGLELV